MSWSDKFSLLTGKWAVIYYEMHCYCWLRNLLEWDCYRIFRRAEGISDMNICNTWDGNDRTDTCFFDFHFIKSVKLIKFAYLYTLHLVFIMMIHDNNILVYADFSIVHFTDTDTTYIFIVVNSADKHLCSGIRITLRGRDVVKNSLKERNHVFSFFIHTVRCDTCFCWSIDKWAVKLFLACIKVDE